MAISDRNAEIWSTRLQREILALESNDDDSKKMELLPPFIKTLGHTLNIEGGIAKIEFRIDVEVAEVHDEEQKETAAAGVEDGEEIDTKVSEGEKTDDVKAEKAITDETKTENVEAGAEETNAEETDATETDNESSKEPSEATPETITDPHVILVLDASMYWRTHDSSEDQSRPPQFYPFTKPLAVIKAGSHLFSGGSTIDNGDEVDIDLDWTPR